MKQKLPGSIKTLFDTFTKEGYDLYLVGGCVRDILLGRTVTDWDFTTNATPENMLKLFPNAFYDNQFGTVGIPLEEGDTKTIVEVTTFRTESHYTDKRHPGEVSWGTHIEEDLMRRDFTMNAMAIKLAASVFSPSFSWEDHVIDPYHGREDIKKQQIVAVGDPTTRFKEDALRLLRAIRLANQLHFSLEDKTHQAIHHCVMLLPHLAMERIRDEFMKILASDTPYEGILLLQECGILDYILPELISGINVSQVRPGRHHTTDVYTHNLLSLKHCPSPNPLVRFATLLHDVGKPKSASTDENGYIIFYNHEVIGARIAYDICNRLRFSRKEREHITTLIRWHMFTVDEHITDSAVRRFIRRVGVPYVKDILDLRIADRLGGGTQTAESWRLKLFKKRIEDQLAPAPFSITDLALNGNDIMEILGIAPSKKVGELLQTLFEEVDEDLSKNTTEFLTNRLKEITRV